MLIYTVNVAVIYIVGKEVAADTGGVTARGRASLRSRQH